jgi:hypothetical protein
MSFPAESLPEVPHELPAAESGEASVAPAPLRKRSRGLAIAGIFLLVSAASAGGWFLWSGASAGRTRGGQPLAGEAEPIAPPPAVDFVIASPPPVSAGPSDNSAAAGGLADRAQRISALATAAGGGKQTDESLIVLPGRQTTPQSEAEVRHQRWEIRLPPDVTLESYARQLDFFDIELGVIGGTDKVTYLSQLTDHDPKQRSAPAGGEGRLYLTWQRGGLAEADRKLAARAKVDTKGKVIAMFCPPRVEKELAELERAEAKKKNIASIRKTAFAIRTEGQGFKIYVVEQQAEEDTPANQR